MTIIFKKEKLGRTIEQLQLHQQKRGSRRNLIGKKCILCFMPFETFRRYPKQTCALCRYENKKDKGAYLQMIIDRDKTEFIVNKDTFYEKQIAKAIKLEQRKSRELKARNCKITKRVISERLSPYLDLLELSTGH